MNKPLTFEEWWDKNYSMANLARGAAEEAWNAARQNMIPADQAVMVPEVGEWPEDTEGIGVYFTPSKAQAFKDSWGWRVIQFIPRPAPQWTPKVGEAVFVLTPTIPSKVITGTITGMEYGGFLVKTFEYPSDVAINLKLLKPFSAANIGKPWEEI